MKTNLKTVACLFAICLLALGARAAVILQEDFTYSDGTLTSVSGGNWTAFSGGGTYPIQDASGIISFTNVPSGTSGEDLKRDFGATVTSGTLYLRALVSITTAPSKTNGDYFLAFYSTNGSGGGYASRIFADTLPGGGWSFGMTNAGGSNPTRWGTALSAGTTYQLFARYDLATRTAAFGVFTVGTTPTESQLTVTSPASSATAGITSVAIRQGSSDTFAGTIDSITVGTSFSDVGGAASAPIILLQPQDATNFAGSSGTFTNVATGNLPLFYQWYYNTNTLLSDSGAISGSTTNILTLSSLATNQSGTYSCVISNSVGTNVTRYARLTVSPLPVPPTIDTNIFPAGSTNITGDTVTFSVVAHGLPTPAYQWRVINGGVTNVVSGSNVSGTNAATLTITGVTTNQSGTYFVNITNASTVGYTSTNSALAVLKVNPPPFLSIAALRGLEDPVTWSATNTTALYTIQGIVTTWTNLTTSGNSEFFIQDASGGIAVFWSGAPASSNLPPAGALVQVTAPLANFSGLLEVEPVSGNSLHSVVVLSTNNPLPKPQPLPFDPNVVNSPAKMEMLEGSYFVVSNVTLNLSTPTFAANANDPMTNNVTHVKTFTNSVLTLNFTNSAGQTFIFFVNSHTDIPNQVKPTGPVTIYGVLGQYVSSSPYIGGYEFTPSRYADIISYVHFTNVLSNVVRYGDLLTNTFTESFLEPGETLTTSVSIADPEGGTVTLTPITAGLPASAHWDGIISGLNATATFHFTPATGDASSNYVVAVAESSTSGTVSTNYWTVYVPTPVEQKIYITEFLANPTTNSSAPNFNPLHRATDTVGISANDQYVEIANRSGTSVQLFGDIDAGNVNVFLEDFSVNGPTLSSSNAMVIYGGNFTESPNLPVYNEPATSGGLSLPTSGTGMIVLRNQDYHIIDRVVYNASSLSTNGSLSRFPTINSAFVPQAYISTNFTTAGRQYDGGSWSQPTKVPAGVNGVGISMVNGQAVLQFTANTSLASTLWSAGAVTGPFQVVFGRQFQTTSGAFTNANPATQQFYFISTQ